MTPPKRRVSSRDGVNYGASWFWQPAGVALAVAVLTTDSLARAQVATPKLGPAFEDEQRVSCDLATARQTIARLDRASFQDQALRFLAKLRRSCSTSFGAVAAESLANDEALLDFHRDDDAACLRVLAGATSDRAASKSLVRDFNRALCGAPCDASDKNCRAAVAARGKALAGRALRAKLRAETKAWCRGCRQGEPCVPTAVEELGKSPHGTFALDWTLKTAIAVTDSKEDKPGRTIFWAGDVNGDGLGDLVFFETSQAMWHHCATVDGECAFPAKDLTVELSCGENGTYATVFQAASDELEDGPTDFNLLSRYSAAVVEEPNTTVKSICLYSGKTVKCTRYGCNREPAACADLSRWGSLETP